MCEVTPTIDYTPDDNGYTLLPPGVTYYTPDIYARWQLLGDKAVFGVRYSDRTDYQGNSDRLGGFYQEKTDKGV